LHLLSTITAQEARSYDTNDWIPITPSNPDSAKKAQGRVLNLDTPNQNFFPENDYVRKRSQPQQYLRETAFQKGTNLRQPKPESPYKFEPVLPLQPPQYVPANQFVQQQVPPQFVPPGPPVQQLAFVAPVQQVPTVQQVQPVQTVQRPPQEQTLNQQLVAPPQSTQNYYDSNKQYDNTATPFNSSYYQPLGTGSISQELLGAIQHQNINSNVNQVQLTTTSTIKPKEEKESVQLLYVPLENLKSNQPVTQQTPIVTRQTEAPRREKQNPRLQNHKLTTNIQNDFVRQALAAHKLQQDFQLGQVSLPTTTTTARPTKRKPNQPPLSVYMEKQGAGDVKDVIEVLKHAKSISVQDSIGPNSPQVFVGPSNIPQPDGYVKFPLPYLSSVQGNRIERKVDQLPFFVAPLSYKTPDGYSKIPLPSPHVGSVVVSTKGQLHEKDSELNQPQTAQNQIVQDFDIKQPFPQFGEEPKPNPYLIAQNSPQVNPNGLLGLGNEFLGGGFGGGSPQDYEDGPKSFEPNYQIPPRESVTPESYRPTPSKDFVSNYRVKEDTPQYFETTPRYQPEEETSRSNYQIPDYQSNEREVESPNSKGLVRDYDIPSLPVESKDTFVPNYNHEEKPQINQFAGVGQSFVPPKVQPQVYSFNEQPVRQTTTTTTTTTTEALPLVQNPYKLVQNPDLDYRIPEYSSRGASPQDPLRQVINQYEIDQINSQFGEGKDENVETIRTTTPVVKSTESYNDYDISTTARTRSRGRHRGRTTTVRTTSTTPNSFADDKYTVLEEFVVQPKSTTVKYTTEVETIPAKVYKLETEKLEPVYIQNQAPLKEQVLSQEALDQQILHGNVQARPNPQPERPTEAVQDPRLTPLVYNRGQNVQEVEEELPVNPYLPGLINNLQDQAVRPLLVPNLLVPTTTTIAPPPPTEEVRVVTTTEAPKVETTTQRRNRGRQRGNSARYSTSSPRRIPTRRRPNYTRPTTERHYARTTTEATSYEPTKRVSNNRQRFRTRGRPVAREQAATERVLQTTENVFKQPPLEGGFQASSGDPQSYVQFDPVVENQQVITVRPDQSGDEKLFKDYHQVYSLPPQNPSTEVVSEGISTSSSPVVDVQIAHTATDRVQEPVIITTSSEEPPRLFRVNSNIQSGGVIYNNKNDEGTTRASVRTRGRSRSRTRFGSTTARPTTSRTTTTTTAKPQEDEEEEFYGFIRKPDFNKPAPAVTQQPLPLYSASYQEPPRTLIQLEDEGGQNQDYESGSVAPVQFVGQIRPKYTTTEAQEYSTEAPKHRSRARIRVPSRKATPHQSYNEVKSHRFDDQVTRRSSNVVRTRGRGKSHFKLPENLTEKSDEHDVEGGNYPQVYFKQKELTTEKPAGFQITIDPAEGDVDEDQVPHSSLYSPQIIRTGETQWVEASVYPAPNDLEIEEQQLVVTGSEEETTTPNEQVENEGSEDEEKVGVDQKDDGDGKDEEEIPTTTEVVETTTPKRRKIGRRRGVWKLIKHRPVDSFETAESQNYYSVVNSLDKVVKRTNGKDANGKLSTTSTTTRPTTARATTSTTENTIFNALYSLLGFATRASQASANEAKVIVQREREEVTTTTVQPTFPEEYTEEITTQEIKENSEDREETTTVAPQTTTPTTTTTTTTTTVAPQTTPTTTTTTVAPQTTTPTTTTTTTTVDTQTTTTTTTEAAVKNDDVDPWQIQDVKTSTSTEISHETEICYKGRCIKSKDDETNL
jgi:hypothetical protein